MNGNNRRRTTGNGRDRNPADDERKIFAPYNFAPLSHWIFEPLGAANISLDRPFADGLNGVLNFQLTTHSPLLVGGKQRKASEHKPGEVQFFEGLEGQPAIPGSSLKGMVRNVLEIASYGKMGLSDDRWLSLRDLLPATKRAYRIHFGDNKLQPRCKAGFLRFQGTTSRDSGWILIPHQFVRVRQRTLVDHASEHWDRDISPIRNKQKAYEKYEKWSRSLKIRFHLPLESANNRRESRAVTPEHQIARLSGTPQPGQKWQEGWLVLTGQPQDSRDGQKVKYLEFIFSEPGPPIPVPAKVIQAFLDGHRETDDWKKRWWQIRDKEPGIPVFYLEEETRVESASSMRAMGLAMLFRLPYRKSIGETIATTNPRHRDPSVMDLAETIFGTINGQAGGLKGRASFSLARIRGDSTQRTIGPVVLSEPKPSYSPIYIRQPCAENGRLSKTRAIAMAAGDREKIKDAPQYATYMDPEAEIRGWKRYPARHQIEDELERHLEWVRSATRRTNNNIKPSVQTILHTLEPGATFEFQLRIHNLRPYELGALLWALTWGDQPRLRHGMGMGKPFGLGQVTISLDESSWQNLSTNDGGDLPGSSCCMKAYEELMNAHFQEVVWAVAKKKDVSWRNSEPVAQLLAMADPDNTPGTPGRLAYMELAEFRQCKGTNRAMPCLVLEPYVDLFDGQTGMTDLEIFPQRGTPTYPEKVEKERARREEERLRKAERERQEALLASMPDIQRELVRELEEHPDPKSRVNYWLSKMEELQSPENKLIAQTLKDFLDQQPKMSKKGSKRAKVKYERIAKLLDDSQPS